MRYIKTFEKAPRYQYEILNDQYRNIVIQKIKEYVTDIFNDYEYDPDFEDCPFYTNLAIIYQKEYITDIYEEFIDSNKIKDITKEKFIEIYEELLKISKENIENLVIENPNLYHYVKDYDNYLDIPEYIKNSHTYNL